MLIKKKADAAKLRKHFDDPVARILESVTYIGYQKENWGDYSGANGILSLLPVDGYYLKRPVPGVIYRAWKPFRGFFRKRNNDYEINSLYLESKVAFDWMHNRNHVYHFLSGENEYFFSGALKRFKRGNRIVCTYHSPVSEYINTVFDHTKIQQIDAAVVVAQNMIDFFSSMLGPDRVSHVPLGVDTDFWCPTASQDGDRESSSRVLFVGSHFRDFDVLRNVIRLIKSQSQEIFVDAVLSAKDAKAMQGISGITVHTGIDDLKLRSLYQAADVLICPFLQCTASLSILEGMACGLPIVATRTGGVPDYVNEESGILTSPGDAEEMAEAVLSILKDESRRASVRVAARRRALELDWKAIAVRLTGVYSTLIGG